MAKTAKVIAIIIYSLYHSIAKMAESVKKGVEDGKLGQATIYQVSETLPQEVLEKMHAPPKNDYPIATPDILKECDGVLFGLSTRFGSVPAQMKHFMDSTGQLWAKNALDGKPVGVFYSTNSQHGGQESAVYSMIPFFVHQAMMFVPLGFAHDAMNSTKDVTGGGPWGAGCIAASDGSRPTADELAVAHVQGQRFAKVAAKLVNSSIE